MIYVITPTHDPRWLERAWDSLKRQTLSGDRWEWCVMPTTPEAAKAAIMYDGTAKLDDGCGPNIGAIKRRAFMTPVAFRSPDDILVELDHDDELEPTALELVERAFDAHPDVGLVYSDCIDVSDTGAPCTYHAHREAWERDGWTFERAETGELYPRTPELSAWSLRTILTSPNHLRAWRRSAYEAAGGHAPSLAVCDDHDLLCRTYLTTRMHRIPQPLYRYHVTGENTWIRRNAEIQRVTREIGARYFERMVERECELRGLPRYDLCGAIGCPPGWTSVDLYGASVIANLRKKRWPFDAGSVGAFRAHDALEHLPDPVNTMLEIYCCLAPGGYLLSMTPSTDGRGAFQDPTHVSFWNENSFWYWTRPEQAKYLRARGVTEPLFDVARLETVFPSDWHREHDVPYVAAWLRKIP